MSPHVVREVIPYGTVKVVEVRHVEMDADHQVLACVCPDEPHAGYLIVYPAGLVDAAPGDHGTLTFTPGGSFGGYWHFRRAERPAPGDPADRSGRTG